MNPIILPPAMGKQQDRIGSSALVRQLVQEKENSKFKPVKLRLKIDLVSYPARAEGLGKQDSNNILNFQESTSILNASTKKVWKPIEGTSYTCNPHQNICKHMYILAKSMTKKQGIIHYIRYVFETSERHLYQGSIFPKLRSKYLLMAYASKKTLKIIFIFCLTSFTFHNICVYCISVVVFQYVWLILVNTVGQIKVQTTLFIYDIALILIVLLSF